MEKNVAVFIGIAAIWGVIWMQLRLTARKQQFIHTIRMYNQLLRAGQDADLPHAQVHFPPAPGFLGQRFVNPSLQDPFERWQEELSTAEVPDQDWVMETANSFYNAYVAAYFQQQKRLQRAQVGLVAVVALTMFFAQE